MSDSKNRRGPADRIRVSAEERYEVQHLANKHGLPEPLVKKVIEQKGPMREDVEKHLEKVKRDAKKNNQD